jgi:hypothetical protein
MRLGGDDCAGCRVVIVDMIKAPGSSHPRYRPPPLIWSRPTRKIGTDRFVRGIEGDGGGDLIEWPLEVYLLEDHSVSDRFGREEQSIGGLAKHPVDGQDTHRGQPGDRRVTQVGPEDT